MDTRIIRREEELPAASEILQKGGLCAVPTETVYGLCADGLNGEAVAKIYAVKGRPENKPLSLMVAGESAMDEYCHDVPDTARTLAAEFWPGPLTIILPAKDSIPSIVLAGGNTVGLRCPDHPLTLALLRDCGLPLAGPSANPSGEEPPVNAEGVLRYFDGKIEAVLDGGECSVGEPSTILDMTVTPYRILRQGGLGEDAIAAALRRRMTVVGLTGGSGVGKTTALRELAGQGALILDCDEIYHALTETSPELKAALCERFGDVYEGNVLDRRKLGNVVFNDEAALADLNAITHRFVVDEVRRQIEQHVMSGGSLCAIDAVALIESGLGALCDYTVAVTAKEELRVKRIMERDGITEDYARSRIRAQKDEAFFAANCDYVLENNGTHEEFNGKVHAFFAVPHEKKK